MAPESACTGKAVGLTLKKNFISPTHAANQQASMPEEWTGVVLSTPVPLRIQEPLCVHIITEIVDPTDKEDMCPNTTKTSPAVTAEIGNSRSHQTIPKSFPNQTAISNQKAGSCLPIIVGARAGCSESQAHGLSFIFSCNSLSSLPRSRLEPGSGLSAGPADALPEAVHLQAGSIAQAGLLDAEMHQCVANCC